MAVDRYIIFLKESNVSPLNAWLQSHPQLDPRGGGGETFTVPVVWDNDPTDGSVVRGRACNWKLPDDWWATFEAQIGAQSLKWNETRIQQWDGSDYQASEGYDLAAALADTTRKPRAMQLVIEEVG